MVRECRKSSSQIMNRGKKNMFLRKNDENTISGTCEQRWRFKKYGNIKDDLTENQRRILKMFWLHNEKRGLGENERHWKYESQHSLGKWMSEQGLRIISKDKHWKSVIKYNYLVIMMLFEIYPKINGAQINKLSSFL